MSVYALNKVLREVNRNPQVCERFMREAAAVAAEFDLTEEERSALVARDIGALYKLGAHGLILRPFTLIHQISEPDYLRAIRG